MAGCRGATISERSTSASTASAGFGSSPSIYKDRLALLCDDPANPFITVLRLSDGRDLWRVFPQRRVRAKLGYASDLCVNPARRSLRIDLHYQRTRRQIARLRRSAACPRRHLITRAVVCRTVDRASLVLLSSVLLAERKRARIERFPTRSVAHRVWREGARRATAYGHVTRSGRAFRGIPNFRSARPGAAGHGVS